MVEREEREEIDVPRPIMPPYSPVWWLEQIYGRLAWTNAMLFFVTLGGAICTVLIVVAMLFSSCASCASLARLAPQATSTSDGYSVSQPIK